MLVAVDDLAADRLDIIERRAKPDGIGDIAGAGFEAARRRLIDRLLERHIGDHVSAALPGRHMRQHIRLAVDDADARRPEDLVAGKDEEIAIDALHVDRHVRDRLRAIDQHASAVAMRDRRHLLDRHDRAERVGDLRDRDDARARPEQPLIFFEDHLPGIVDRRDAQLGARRHRRAAARARYWRDARAR